MANSGKNSNGCQFFITLAPAPQCDGKHVVLGEVVEGLQVLQRIGEVAALWMSITTALFAQPSLALQQELLAAPCVIRYRMLALCICCITWLHAGLPPVA